MYWMKKMRNQISYKDTWNFFLHKAYICQKQNFIKISKSKLFINWSKKKKCIETKRWEIKFSWRSSEDFSLEMHIFIQNARLGKIARTLSCPGQRRFFSALPGSLPGNAGQPGNGISKLEFLALYCFKLDPDIIFSFRTAVILKIYLFSILRSLKLFKHKISQ